MDTMENSNNNTAVQDNAAQPESQVQQTEARQAASQPTYLPAVDIIDGKDETILITDMPGVDQSGLEISIEKSVLTIKGTPKEQKYEGKGLVYSEYGVGDYERSFTLSEDVDRDHVSASIKDGVLKVKLPKAAPVTRKIAVEAS